MHKNKIKLPVGIESFRDIRTEGFYYIDKTEMIRELVNSWAKVNLFTRPRRFGKTLNMDMLKTFFEWGTDKRLFDGLRIAEDQELCRQYMGRFPVISISLKEAGGNTFDEALKKLSIILRREVRRFQFLLESDRLTEVEKDSLEILFRQEIESGSQQESLMLLSEMLCKHYGEKVIILIDEYDVPLEKAYLKGYYDDMVDHLRTMFGMALKTNEFLYFAVLTGCLRISKESIFTGLNNFRVLALSDVQYDEAFGFTDQEVRTLLSDYGMEEKYEEVREWYDGFSFGQESIYCPWDVLNYVSDHLTDRDAEPKLYWANSSGNAIIKNLIESSTGTVKGQIEDLLEGRYAAKEIIQEMTYQDLSAKNTAEKMIYLWSLLYNTGYVTDAESPKGGIHKLKIPNREIRMIFEQQISLWFSQKVERDTGVVRAFCQALAKGDADIAQESFNQLLRDSISIRDTAGRKGRKESFYHGILLGLLAGQEDWIVKSNPETGDGYCDILAEILPENTGCVIEVKYAENGALEQACKDALRQIHEKRYAEKLLQDGMDTIRLYGVACRKKTSRIVYEGIFHSFSDMA